MPIIRTPDERFENLAGYPFAPHYVEIDGLRMHYIDEGQGDDVILCLHGEPSWSYLYRKMVAPFTAAGLRVIAPDLIGFGRSDKFTEQSEYSFSMHYRMLEKFLKTLDPRRVTLVCQDWGGILGLPLAASHQGRFSRLVIMNTGLPTGEEPMPAGFLAWKEFALRTPELVASMVIDKATVSELPADVKAAYDAPFPDARYKAGMQVFPALVPVTTDMEGAAELRETRHILREWTKPALVMFSDSDPVTRGGDRFFRALIPTAHRQPEITIQGGGHFLQEDKGEEIAGHILAFIARTPTP